jgi:ligand-binding SRPBCC domain-containing protein
MRVFTFNSEIWLPHPPDVVFSFFADARNLEILTPPWLQFKVLTPGKIKMATGTFIDYRLRIHGIPLRWKSEITCWEPPHVFVDEQRRGPYTLWVHEHRFKENEGGTLAVDSVRYAVPGGKLLHDLFVKRDIKNNFTYRTEKLREVFTSA